MTSGFEAIHGALDRALAMVGVGGGGAGKGYALVAHSDPAFFDGRCARVEVGGVGVGVVGVVHPTVLAAFDIAHPCSALEINIEGFV
jgi:phenylalanyl-tRNA synthetase beta chain